MCHQVVPDQERFGLIPAVGVGVDFKVGTGARSL
jgi:hypothetical protein